jgi:hypothetical protein
MTNGAKICIWFKKELGAPDWLAIIIYNIYIKFVLFKTKLYIDLIFPFWVSK